MKIKIPNGWRKFNPDYTEFKQGDRFLIQTGHGRRWASVCKYQNSFESAAIMIDYGGVFIRKKRIKKSTT